SDVRIILDAGSIPIHPAVREQAADDESAIRMALTGGEDYELCFAAPPGAVERLVEAFTDTFRLPLTCVGSVHEGAGVMLRLDGAVVELPWTGHDHFAAHPS